MTPTYRNHDILDSDLEAMMDEIEQAERDDWRSASKHFEEEGGMGWLLMDDVEGEV